MTDKFSFPVVGIEDRVFQAALFYSGDYEGCERYIDWKSVKEENDFLPENSESIFQQQICKKYTKWNDDECETLEKIINTPGCKSSQIRKTLPNRSIQGTLNKIRKIKEKKE